MEIRQQTQRMLQFTSLTKVKARSLANSSCVAVACLHYAVLCFQADARLYDKRYYAWWFDETSAGRQDFMLDLIWRSAIDVCPV